MNLKINDLVAACNLRLQPCDVHSALSPSPLWQGSGGESPVEKRKILQPSSHVSPNPTSYVFTA